MKKTVMDNKPPPPCSLQKLATTTMYDSRVGKTLLSADRAHAMKMTYLIMHRHWFVGSFFVLIPLIILAPDIRSLFHVEDGFSKSDVNEPVGAVVGFLGSVYALATVFAFQSSRDRITHITEAIHSELSALQRMQLLVRCSADPEIKAQILQAVAAYARTVGVELKPDAYSFGNTLYSTKGERCEATIARDQALFGTRPLRQLYECVDGMDAMANAAASHRSDAIAAEFRELLGSLVEGRNRRLAHMMSRMPLTEWCFLELGSYIFMYLMALLDTGDVNRDRLLIAVTGGILLALNHIVADANEPLLGSFKVKKTLMNQFIIMAGESAELASSRSLKINVHRKRFESVQETAERDTKSEPDCTGIAGASEYEAVCPPTPSTTSALAKRGGSVQPGPATQEPHASVDNDAAVKEAPAAAPMADAGEHIKLHSRSPSAADAKEHELRQTARAAVSSHV